MSNAFGHHLHICGRLLLRHPLEAHIGAAPFSNTFSSLVDLAFDLVKDGHLFRIKIVRVKKLPTRALEHYVLWVKDDLEVAVVSADVVNDILNGAVAREESLIQFCRVIKNDEEVLEN